MLLQPDLPGEELLDAQRVAATRLLHAELAGFDGRDQRRLPLRRPRFVPGGGKSVTRGPSVISLALPAAPEGVQSERRPEIRSVLRSARTISHRALKLAARIIKMMPRRPRGFDLPQTEAVPRSATAPLDEQEFVLILFACSPATSPAPLTTGWLRPRKIDTPLSYSSR